MVEVAREELQTRQHSLAQVRWKRTRAPEKDVVLPANRKARVPGWCQGTDRAVPLGTLIFDELRGVLPSVLRFEYIDYGLNGTMLPAISTLS